MSSRCLIVGAGHAAAQLCASLRQGGWEGSITLIGNETTLPYHRPPLSKTQLNPSGGSAVQLIRPEAFYESNEIEVLTGTHVETIDRNNRTVTAAGQVLPYDKLVLCTGSLHRRPPIQGVDHPRVFHLRTSEDAAQVRARAAAATRAVIVGAGFIGLEVAASLRKLGLEVTVLEMAPRVLARVTSPEVSAFFERLHREKGVDLRCGISASEIREADGGLDVLCADGSSCRGDFVVLGAGAEANAALAADAELVVENGIRVDAFNCSSDPDIYALGDCCNQFNTLYQDHLRLESVQNAIDQARTVAAALNDKAVAHNALPWFWSDQYDVKLQIAGVASGFESVVIRGNPVKDRSFSAWYYARGRLLAVDAINDAIAYAVGAKLLKTGKQPDPALVADTRVETKQLLIHAKEPDHA